MDVVTHTEAQTEDERLPPESCQRIEHVLGEGKSPGWLGDGIPHPLSAFFP